MDNGPVVQWLKIPPLHGGDPCSIHGRSIILYGLIKIILRKIKMTTESYGYAIQTNEEIPVMIVNTEIIASMLAYPYHSRIKFSL